MLKKWSWLVLSLTFISTAIFADGASIYSVQDAEAIAKLKEQLKDMDKSLSQMRDMYNTANQSLEQTKQIKNDLDGAGNYHYLLSDAHMLGNQYQWTASTWEDALKGLSGGNSARYNELLDQYKKENPTLTASQYQEGASKAKTAVYEQQVQVNQASATSATYEYDQLNQLSQQIKQISDQVDNATTTKQALDLNSKLTEQVAYIQLELLKMQVLMNQQAAESMSSTIAGETEQAKYLATLK